MVDISVCMFSDWHTLWPGFGDTPPVDAELLAFITLIGAAVTVVVQLIIQRRTEKQALFTTLLPKNLKNSESYDLPLQSSIDWIVALA
jgi:hypothetical protein